MADRKVWVKPDEDEGGIWVGLDTSKKTTCLLLSDSEASALLMMLNEWQEARRA